MAFSSITTLLSPIARAEDFCGQWDWNDAPFSQTFSVTLVQKGYLVSGRYCAVAKAGRKIDCDDESAQNIKGKIENFGNEAVVRFYSFFDARDGEALLVLKNNTLIWKIIRNPRGEFYAPQFAIMARQRHLGATRCPSVSLNE